MFNHFGNWIYTFGNFPFLGHCNFITKTHRTFSHLEWKIYENLGYLPKRHHPAGHTNAQEGRMGSRRKTEFRETTMISRGPDFLDLAHAMAN